MMGPGFMLGAKDRLLPPSIPYRFFATAVIMHVAGWAALSWGAWRDALALGGPGPGLAALHVFTLGVLGMTALGAAFQLLPVATGRQLGPVGLCRLTWWLYAPGVAVLTHGMGSGHLWAMHLGTTLVVAGLALFALLVGRLIAKVGDMPGVTWPVWAALASLAALAALGVLLIADYDAGFLSDRTWTAAAHAIFAGYGFMGMLALGFSTVLMPMFVLSRPVPDADGKRIALAAIAALVLGGLGALAGLGWLAALGALAGLGAAGLHLKAMEAVLKARMRRKLESFFRMVKLAWAMLPLGLAVGFALAAGAPADPLGGLWVLALVFGWLLTMVLGILQRIMPFLASMHSGKGGAKPALLSHLVAETPLRVHFHAHWLALALLAVWQATGEPLAVRAGAAAGLAGALAFAWFVLELARRYRAHERANLSESQT